MKSTVSSKLNCILTLGAHKCFVEWIHILGSQMFCILVWLGDDLFWLLKVTLENQGRGRFKIFGTWYVLYSTAYEGRGRRPPYNFRILYVGDLRFNLYSASAKFFSFRPWPENFTGWLSYGQSVLHPSLFLEVKTSLWSDLSVGWLVCPSVCHNFLSERKSMLISKHLSIPIHLYLYTIIFFTGFSTKDARLLKYKMPIFSIILPSFSALIR